MVRKLRYGMVLGLAILITDALVPLILAHRVAEMRAAAVDANDVTTQLQTLLSAFQDAETGQRGFMLTGQETFLIPYHEGHRTLDTLLPQLGQEITDPQQRERWQHLRELWVQEAEFQRQRIEVRRRGEAIDVVAAEHGKQLMDGIRAEIGAMSSRERQHAADLLARVARLEHWSRVSIIVITAVDLVLFAIIYTIALRALREQSRARQALKQSHDQLLQEIGLRSEAMEQMQWQAGRLNEIVLLQTSLTQAELEVSSFLDQIVRKMLKVTSASGAVVEMIDGDEMVYKAASGTVSEFVGLRLRRHGGLSGRSIAENALLSATDTRNDPRVDRAACEKIGVRSMIVVPLRREGEAIGVLKIVAGEPGAFTPGDTQALQLMAGFLGAALGHQLQFEKNQALLSERSFTLAKLEHELERREENERLLLSQRQRTETILEAAHEAFICIDQQGIVREWNAASVSTFGWSKQQALNQPLTSLIIPDRFRDIHNRGIAHFLRTGEGPVLNRRIELPALCRDGREIPIEMTIFAVQLGDHVEFACFLRDITERKKAEEALLHQQDTLRALTDAIPALVAFVDADEIYRYCNQQYEGVFGVTPEKIIGLTLQQFLGDELYQRYENYFKRSLAGETVTYERTMQMPTGTHHQECRHVPQLDADGKPSGFYVIAWDITQRKMQEIEWQSRASTDQLTGLMSRAHFLETLKMAIANHQRANAALAVLYLDVDRFKQINDTFGHAAGDTVLQSFAEYLKISVRQSDVVGRLGGDEFCILLDNIRTPENTTAVAEKILALARIPVVHGEHHMAISTSIGIAFAPAVTGSAEDLIASADAALYKAKQQGRNRFVLDVVGVNTDPPPP